MAQEEVVLTRDCEGTQIPQGIPFTVPKGTPAFITQALGETYTLRLPTLGKLIRIADKDADAIGKSSTQGTRVAAQNNGPLTEDMVWAQLREVYDPEIPINVVDLGLVYDLRLESLPNGRHNVFVQMTLTAQGCGMGPSIARDAQRRIEALPNVAEVDVRIVWDPQWHPDMMSAEGKKRLGVE